MKSEGRQKRIVFAGGGTAGHLMPAINIAREMIFLNPAIEPRFVGKKDGMERAIVTNHGFEIDEMDIIGMKRSLTGVVKFAIKWFGGYRQALNILGNICPLAVVGTGGYISAPVVKAAHKRKIPVFLQEQNSLPGLASRILSKYAAVVFTAYEAAAGYLDKTKCRLVGNPVRSDISSGNRPEFCGRFNLDPNKSTLLVLGGSSGARGINRALPDILSTGFPADLWQVLWQTGRSDYEHVRSSIPADRREINIIDFINDMPGAYAAADLVISRAGAMALSEISAVGLASVLIPFPYATGDHQTLNARSFEQAGAAVVIPEKIMAAQLKNILTELLTNPEKRRTMAEKALGLGKPDAARIIAKEILERLNEV